MAAPEAEDIACDIRYLGGSQIGWGHGLMPMRMGEKRLQGLGVDIGPVGDVVKTRRIMGKQRRIWLIRRNDMTDIALAERQAAAFLRGGAAGRLLRACGAANRSDKDRQKDCPWPHRINLSCCHCSALIHVNHFANRAKFRR